MALRRNYRRVGVSRAWDSLTGVVSFCSIDKNRRTSRTNNADRDTPIVPRNADTPIRFLTLLGNER